MQRFLANIYLHDFMWGVLVGILFLLLHGFVAPYIYLLVVMLVGYVFLPPNRERLNEPKHRFVALLWLSVTFVLGFFVPLLVWVLIVLYSVGHFTAIG